LSVLLVTIFLFGLVARVNAQNDKLSAFDKEQIITDTFAKITKVNDLPLLVKSYISKLSTGKQHFTDPGRPFEVNCDDESGLPRCRLVYAAVNAKYCLIYYEAGGAAYKQILEILRMDHNVVKEIYFTKVSFAGYPRNIQFKSIEELKDIISNSK
jgi:hypothetical protein